MVNVHIECTYLQSRSLLGMSKAQLLFCLWFYIDNKGGMLVMLLVACVSKQLPSALPLPLKSSPAISQSAIKQEGLSLSNASQPGVRMYAMLVIQDPNRVAGGLSISSESLPASCPLFVLQGRYDDWFGLQ